MPKTKYTKADRKPTWTSLTTQALQESDDFMTMPQLCAATGASANQMGATLSHLKRVRVVDVMEAEGQLWFYLTGDDDRSIAIGARVQEPVGNRTRAPGYHTSKRKKPTAD